ncbi:MAG: LicD family protein [Lentilactobacillus hilgardii]|uniref:LicD family protein n=1 Tax=Lentilactobacillus hilgardii TaxID=1588 RepID=UPI0039EC8955
MSETTISLIHQVELKIFKRFKQIVQQYEIPYIAMGGTLLGAVRHHGFIPWDDDMDVGMLRDDYEKFLQICSAEFQNDSYFLQTPWTDENYALSYAKILDRNTYIEEKNNVNNARKGVFLDIFPLDKIPASPSRQRHQIIQMRRLDSRIYLKLRYNVIDNPIRRLQSSLSPEQILAASQFKKQRQQVMTQFNSKLALTDFKNLASQYAYDKEIISQDQLENTMALPFENTQITVPKDFDTILTNIYGNYLQLPPVNQRNDKHIARLIMDNQEFEG